MVEVIEPVILSIINPSDSYTMETDNFLAACIATCLLGDGKYGLDEVGGEKKMPIFFFGGHDEWFTEQFGKTFEQCLNDAPPVILAECLESVLIGSPTDRQAYKDGLELIDDTAKRQQWYERWHDQRRSSMNDIGSYARQLAGRLREIKTK